MTGKPWTKEQWAKNGVRILKCELCGAEFHTTTAYRTLCGECSSKVMELIESESLRRGYKFEKSADGKEIRLIRPDGTTAVTARKPTT